MRSVPLYLSGVVLAAFLLVSSVPAQDTPSSERAPSTLSKPTQVEVFELKYAVATELVQIVQHALPAVLLRGAKIIADPRTNSLVVLGQEADILSVRSVVVVLDVPWIHGKAAPAFRVARER